MTPAQYLEKIRELLEEAGHVPGAIDLKLDERPGEPKASISIPIVLITPQAKGGVELKLVADTEEALLEEALSLVELLVGKDPDDRHGFPKEAEKKVEPIAAESFPLGGQIIDRFVISPSERGLILALREGRLLAEIEERLLAQVAEALDPGGDFTFHFDKGQLETAREKAFLAGLTKSDRSAWLFAFGEFARKATVSHYFANASAVAFTKLFGNRRIEEIPLVPEIEEGLVGKPDGSTLLLARLLSRLYLSKLIG